jgi:hypothetical protein
MKIDSKPQRARRQAATAPDRVRHGAPLGAGNRRVSWLSIGLILVAVAGCKYRGGIDEPVVRKATWFSYLAGTDIRESCAPGVPDRFRFVYNARYTDQVRSYEVVGDGAGGAYLVARALGPVELDVIPVEDIQAPWRWKTSETRLSATQLAAFEQTLAESGFFGPSPEGLRLYSDGFYWVGAGCRDGVFAFNAWQFPSPDFARLTFPAFLFAQDATGVRIAQPYRTYGKERLQQPGHQADWQWRTKFTLQVRGQGLGGISEL